MTLSRLAEKLEWLDDHGCLTRVNEPVDPEDPLHVIADETLGAKAVFLSNLKGRRFPMVGRLMADPERICRLAGLEGVEHLACVVEQLVHKAEDEDASFTLSPIRKAIVKQPACQQVVRMTSDINATVLPSLRVDPEEDVQKITGSTLFTVEPDSGRQLAASVDLVVESPTRLVPQWKVEDQLDVVRADYAASGSSMPVAILLGGDPLIRVVAEAPKPAPIDPMVIAASLSKKKLKVTPCRTLPELTISADTDMVIEGHWIPADDVIEVQAVTHRINPIVPFALPDERELVRRTLLQGLLPWWRAEVPGLADLILPRWAEDGTVLVGSVEKAYAKKTQRIDDTLAEHPAWHGVRLVILLDETVKLSDESAVLAALAQNADFGRKTLIAVETS